jgi:hypothetical protein
MKATRTLVLTGILLTASPIPATANVCYIGLGGGILRDYYRPRPHKFQMTLAGCIQFLASNRQSLGQWGNSGLQLDRMGRAFLNGRFVGNANQAFRLPAYVQDSPPAGREYLRNKSNAFWAGQEKRNWDYYRSKQAPLH